MKNWLKKYPFIKIQLSLVGLPNPFKKSKIKTYFEIIIDFFFLKKINLAHNALNNNKEPTKKPTNYGFFFFFLS